MEPMECNETYHILWVTQLSREGSLSVKHGWQRTVFTEHDQVFKYPEEAFRPSEQMFRYLVLGTWYQVPVTKYLVPGNQYQEQSTKDLDKRSDAPNTEHQDEDRTVRTVLIAKPAIICDSGMAAGSLHLERSPNMTTFPSPRRSSLGH
jgi:hypothetical protein